MPESAPLLVVEDLKTHFFTRRGATRAVDGVSFTLRAGETLALVGESGSGKSVTCLSLVRLVPEPAGRIVGGRVLLDTRIDGIETAGGRIVALRAGDARFATQNVVWTAPITLANQLLGLDGLELEYLSTIFYNLEIDAPIKYDFQWTYYGGDDRDYTDYPALDG